MGTPMSNFFYLFMDSNPRRAVQRLRGGMTTGGTVLYLSITTRPQHLLKLKLMFLNLFFEFTNTGDSNFSTVICLNFEVILLTIVHFFKLLFTFTSNVIFFSFNPQPNEYHRNTAHSITKYYDTVWSKAGQPPHKVHLDTGY